jgi:hypothetical protein
MKPQTVLKATGWLGAGLAATMAAPLAAQSGNPAATAACPGSPNSRGPEVAVRRALHHRARAGGTVVYCRDGEVDILKLRRAILANLPDVGLFAGNQAYMRQQTRLFRGECQQRSRSRCLRCRRRETSAPGRPARWPASSPWRPAPSTMCTSRPDWPRRTRYEPGPVQCRRAARAAWASALYSRRGPPRTPGSQALQTGRPRPACCRGSIP